MKVKIANGLAYNFNELFLLLGNLKLNGFDFNTAISTRIGLTKRKENKSEIYYDHILTKQIITIEYKDLSYKSLDVTEYPLNCSAIFLNRNEFDFEELYIMSACAGFTFIFSDYDMFNKSIKIADNLYLLHINAEYNYTGIYDCSLKYINNYTGITIETFDTEGNYSVHKPFNGIKFVHKFRVHPDKIHEDNSFLIYELFREKSTDFNNYKLVYSAISNRTRNELGILVSKDLL